MSDGGKGDLPRPLSVRLEEFDERFDAIFGKKKPKETLSSADYEFDEDKNTFVPKDKE